MAAPLRAIGGGVTSCCGCVGATEGEGYKVAGDSVLSALSVIIRMAWMTRSSVHVFC